MSLCSTCLSHFTTPISVLPYSTCCTELEDPTLTGTMTLRIVGSCVHYTTRVLLISVCVNCYFLQQIPAFSSLNNKHSTKQSHPLNVNNKEVMDKLEIASNFNTLYLAQHNLDTQHSPPNHCVITKISGSLLH